MTFRSLAAVAGAPDVRAKPARISYRVFIGWLAAFELFEIARIKIDGLASFGLNAFMRDVSALELLEVYFLVAVLRACDPADSVMALEAGLVIGGLAVLTLLANAPPLVVIAYVTAYLIARNARRAWRRPAGTALAAFMGQYLFSYGPFIWFDEWVGRIDAAVVRWALPAIGIKVSGSGTIIITPDHLVAIDVKVGCASTFPAAAVASGFIVLVLGSGRAIAVDERRRLAALIAAATLLNWLRLALMARSHADYLYWHDGWGAQIIALLDACLVLLFARAPTRAAT